MLNGSPVSWCSKTQLTITLLSIEIKSIALILVIKKTTKLYLLLTKLGFFYHNKQDAFIKGSKANTYIKKIYKNKN